MRCCQHWIGGQVVNNANVLDTMTPAVGQCRCYGGEIGVPLMDSSRRGMEPERPAQAASGRVLKAETSLRSLITLAIASPDN